MADYPSATTSFTSQVGTSSSPLSSPDMPTWALKISNEVVAIETELGTLPKGSSTDVKTRLNTLDTTVAGKAALAGATFTGKVAEAVVALTDAATITTDASLGNVFTVTLGGNRTIANPTNVTSGQKIIYRLKQDGTGTRLVTWDTAFRFGTDVTSPTLTTTVSKTDYVGFIYNAADSKWDCVAVARGY